MYLNLWQWASWFVLVIFILLWVSRAVESVTLICAIRVNGEVQLSILAATETNIKSVCMVCLKGSAHFENNISIRSDTWGSSHDIHALKSSKNRCPTLICCLYYDYFCHYLVIAMLFFFARYAERITSFPFLFQVCVQTGWEPVQTGQTAG